jgi:ATP-dependent Clp protease adaptor protein ClpS
MATKSQEKISLKYKEPNIYNVIMINDDFTPMDFVVDVLLNIFHFRKADAIKIMFQIHNDGSAICGEYTFEIAQTKVSETMIMARDNGYPLRCELKEVE